MNGVVLHLHLHPAIVVYIEVLGKCVFDQKRRFLLDHAQVHVVDEREIVGVHLHVSHVLRRGRRRGSVALVGPEIRSAERMATGNRGEPHFPVCSLVSWGAAFRGMRLRSQELA